MKINIASYGGRNWLLELARELDKQGHEVKFYSYLPSSRALKFGLKKECNFSYFVLALPFLALLKMTNRSFWSLYLFHRFFDFYMSIILKPCDIFIGQSPMHVKALNVAKRKYNAKIILERGTSHVLNYIKVLSANPAFKDKEIMPKKFLLRDLEGYKISDYIAVPSTYVADTFIENGISENKLIINPYGTNLAKFNKTVLDVTETFDVIIVGQWSYRKGADLLTKLCESYNISLLHVGPIIDVVFPKNDKMKHVDSVEEFKLLSYYKQAKVFVLPSREEGFGIVMAQAVACGLPIVCSEYTGAKDLRSFIDNKDWITVMKEYSVTELYDCIKIALNLASSQNGDRNYSKNLDKNLSWEAYGQRYNEFLKTLL
tara:strand:- start:2249 stop:3367 length:1119 start_codon:yes stop_codon:yes gene_type:complete